MQHLSDSPDKCMRIIDEFLSKRLRSLEGRDKDALFWEYKEWLINENNKDDEIWAIPDLTDEGLCDFFKRAIDPFPKS